MANTPAPADTAETVDLANPCAVAAVLRRALLRALAGDGEVRVRFRDGESEEDVTYGQPNIAALKAELSRQDALCTASKGGRARFCVRAG